MSSDTPAHQLARAAMVEALRTRGVRDRRLLAALRAVPRHWFVPAAVAELAYDVDAAQPAEGLHDLRVLATMLEALELRGDECVLEVGTGSGYRSALLAQLAPRVHSIELSRALHESARATLDRLELAALHLVHGDGLKGFPAAAPYHAILVSAGASDVPPALLEQLEEGGRLVIPIGNDEHQLLTRFRKRGNAFYSETLTWCRLPTLTGGPRRRPSWPWARVAGEY